MYVDGKRRTRTNSQGEECPASISSFQKRSLVDGICRCWDTEAAEPPPSCGWRLLHGEVAGAGREPRVGVAGHLHQPFAPGAGGGSFFYSFHHPFSSVIDGAELFAVCRG